MAYKYLWQSVDSKAEDSFAQADTPLGRIKVERRRNTNKFVAWVQREVIGREYVNMDAAKAAAEAKVMKILLDKQTD